MLALCLTALLCGCVHEEIDPLFLESSDVALQVDGKTVFVYSPATGQLAYNRDLCRFRAGSDDMDSYFTFTCNDLPEREGQTVKASLEWKTASASGHRNGIRFSVKKVSDNGMIWLWNARDRIAIAVRRLD